MKTTLHSFLKWMLFILPLLVTATEYTINSADEFNDLNLSAGDVVIWQDGTYSSDERIKFLGNGTSSNPITLKAETPGGVIFTGGLSMDIAGNYLVVDGFYWNGGFGASNFIQFRSGTTYAQNCTIKNCAINGLQVDPDDIESGTSVKHRWIVLYGNYNNVLNCSFMNKSTAGALVLVELEYNAEANRCAEVGHNISNNYFYNYEKIDASLTNAGDSETIRVGTSEFQNVDCRTTVSNNYFVSADGENEIITNKSDNNTYTNNTFRKCRGSLVLRHGSGATVEGNYFLGENVDGTGGIRIVDSDHIITNNYIQDCITVVDQAKWNNGITFMGGGDSSVDNCTTTSVSNGYQKSEDVVVSNNTIVNTNAPLFFNGDKGTNSNTGNVSNNVIFFETGSSNTTDVITEDGTGDFSDIGSSLTYSGNVYDGANIGESVSGFSSSNLSASNNGEILTISGAGNAGANIASTPLKDSDVSSKVGACFLNASGALLSDCSGDVIIDTDELTATIPPEFSANGDTKTITIRSNIAWTVNESSSWITTDKTSGANNGTVTVTTTANTSTSSRSASISIQGNSITRTITISQAGAEATNSTTLTLLDSYDIGAVGEPSGLAYDKANNQLFSVNDGNNIFRLSTTGQVLDTYNFSGDLEGVTVYDTNTLLVAIEDTYQLVEYNYITGNSTSHTMDYDNQNDPGSGIEGVTYNPSNGEIYFLNEKDPAALVVANSSFNVTDEYELSFSGDLSASAYVEETGFLWLGSDETSTLYKCTTNGTVVETLPLGSLDKLEGIAIDYENQLVYVVTDGDAQLYVYGINGAQLPVIPTNGDCTEGSNLAENANISDFSSEQNTTNGAANIVDGNTSATNRWSAEFYPQYVVVDLGAENSVNEINLVPYSGRDYQFLVEGSTSSGSGFTTLVDATDNTSGASLINKTFTSQNVRYVKLTITGAATYAGDWISITEFQVLCSGETVEPSNLVLSSISDFDAEGESQSINVTSNVDWTVSESSAWLAVDTASGSDNGSFTITATENTSASGRSATISVTGGGITKTLSVTQAEQEDIVTTAFIPNPEVIYYIDSPIHNLRLAATGEVDDAYTTTTSTTGEDVEWKFVDKGNGYWHIQLAAGGSMPRLRTDNGETADMQGTGWSGTYTYYDFADGVYENSYFLTLPDGPTERKRLQIDRDGIVKMVSTASAGTWESFTITEVITNTITASECVAGTNLALNSTVVDFSAEQNTTNGVANLADGNDSNRWSAEFFPQYAVIDLGAVYAVDEINLVPYDSRAYQFLVEGSANSATDGFSTLTDATGNTSGANPINKTFTSQNVRYVKLTVTGASGYTGSWSSIQEFQVICAGEEVIINNSLTVSSVSDFGAEEQMQAVNVTSNVDWSVNENSSWLSVNTTSGSNSDSFNITCSENTSTSDRSTEISVTGGGITRDITISQAGKEEIVIINPDATPCTAGTNLSLNGSIIDFSSEQDADRGVANLIDGDDTNRWSGEFFPQYAVIDLGAVYEVEEINLVPFSSRAYQFTVEGSATTSSYSTLVDATGNTTEASSITKTFNAQNIRYVKLTITGVTGSYTGDWASINEFKVICAGEVIIPDDLSVSSISNFNTNGGSQDVTVSSNIDWAASVSSDWISIDNGNGSDDGVFAINATENTSTSPRNATVTVTGGSLSRTIAVNQLGVRETNGELDPTKAPSENFDLSQWYLSVPINNDDDLATTIQVDTLNEGYELKDYNNRDYFYTGSDGGMVFVNYPYNAPKTSEDTSYSRNELREMLTGGSGDTSNSTKDPGNNWYFGSSDDIPTGNEDADDNAGGIDGVLTATLRVNHVTEFGSKDVQKGRIIIGQIHASKNEPCRLYYHKLPEHDKGAIYVAHEDRGGTETFYNIIGNYVEETGGNAGDLLDDVEEPSDGIELNEEFSYKIEVVGNKQYVTILRDGKEPANIREDENNPTGPFIDMSDSDYENDWMYFKAGIYSQNNTTTSSSDYDQVTFYALKQTHDAVSSNKNLTTALIEDITVYPNPFAETINISLGVDSIAVRSVSISDGLGRVILSKVRNENDDIIQLNGNFSSGTYYIQLLDINGTVIATRKAIHN